MPIKIKHIWKSYGEQRVLADFSLTVEDGEKICLMGASGIGKTTILSILAGLVKPDFGEIEGMDGKKLSMVFQEDRLLEWADAFENVALILERKKSGMLREVLRGEFEAVGLHDYEEKPVSQLSGGMKRRVAIVRAVCAEGDLLLLDEPFKGLDDGTKEQVAAYLKGRFAGRTMVMVTHDARDAKLLGARIVMCGEKKS